MENRDQILQTIREIMGEMFEYQREEILLETRLKEDLDFDSIDAVDLIVKLTEITGKSVKPEDFKAIFTINDLVEAVYKLVNRDK